MNIVCLDMEGVLVPEIWIAFAEASGIPELRRTTRDEPDYDKLMRYRIAILKEHGLKLQQIQETIAKIDPHARREGVSRRAAQRDAGHDPQRHVRAVRDAADEEARLSDAAVQHARGRARRRDPRPQDALREVEAHAPSARCSPSAMRRSPPATASTIWA